MSHLEAQPHPRREGASEESDLLARMRGGDEAAFAALVERHHPTMLAVAQTYVRDADVAAEVAEEAWMRVLGRIGEYDAGSSVAVWIMRIVVEAATERAAERPSLAPEGVETAVEAERFRGADDGFPGHWRTYPDDWQEFPHETLVGRPTLDVVMRAIEELPAAQRTVIMLRDVQGCGADEVCGVLDISAEDQRELLHRARSRVRAALEEHLRV